MPTADLGTPKVHIPHCPACAFIPPYCYVLCCYDQRKWVGTRQWALRLARQGAKECWCYTYFRFLDLESSLGLPGLHPGLRPSCKGPEINLGTLTSYQNTDLYRVPRLLSGAHNSIRGSGLHPGPRTSSRAQKYFLGPRPQTIIQSCIGGPDLQSSSRPSSGAQTSIPGPRPPSRAKPSNHGRDFHPSCQTSIQCPNLHLGFRPTSRSQTFMPGL